MLIGKNGGFMNYRSYVGKDYGGKIKRIILNVLGYVSDWLKIVSIFNSRIFNKCIIYNIFI